MRENESEAIKDIRYDIEERIRIFHNQDFPDGFAWDYLGWTVDEWNEYVVHKTIPACELMREDEPVMTTPDHTPTIKYDKLYCCEFHEREGLQKEEPVTTINQQRAYQIKRHFTAEHMNPYHDIQWETRNASIVKADGKPVFEQKDVVFPSFWSQNATNIVASKYFRTIGGKREYHAGSMIERVAGTIADWGIQDGYFTDVEFSNFHHELIYILVHQLACFNSPVWFNIGVPDRTPQASACFILNVEDTMESILNWYTEEGMIFKGGSGAGINVSKIRSKKELMSGGGRPSGPLSFMKAADASAGVIKSGGVTRRAAKMVVMDIDHPDIEDFIWCKALEERKARALIAIGYDDSIDGEAYGTVAFQNANHSVSVTDDFLRKAQAYEVFCTKNRTNYEGQEHKAEDLLHQIAQAAWECGDPGLFFYDAINAWHTTPARGPIVAPNPCQPGYATVLTPDGIRTFDDIDVGSHIWSGKRWTKVVKKIATGKKDVFEYQTSAGVFIGTKEHQVISNGDRIDAYNAESIDIAHGPENKPRTIAQDFIPQAVVDGLVLGDGSAKALSKTSTTPYVLLCVGKEDHDYFLEDSGVSDFINPEPFDKFFHRVKTTFSHGDMRKTYEREVPDYYFHSRLQTKRSFLRGLYSANGSVVSDRVTLKAASFQVITRVQQMLSSMGIASYYTTNGSHEVEFKNGTYVCKESYDLNITVDRNKFKNLIGFIQKDKQRRLDAICDGHTITRRKETYDIRTCTYVGKMPVYDITVEDKEHTYWTGGLLVSNCSEFLRPPNEACNLSSINLLNFLKEDGSFDIDGFKHTVDVMITAMEILVSRSEYPTPAITQNSEDYRTLGLGYANLGALLMAKGLPYDSDEGRDYAASITSLMTGEAYKRSAELAAIKGSFNGFAANRTPMLHVIFKHIDSIPKSNVRNTAALIWMHAHNTWLDAEKLGSNYGYRNAQVSLLAPTGTISFMMDCTTTGVEPDVALVNYKKLVGGGTIKHVNDIVPRALKTLGYKDYHIKEIIDHIEKGGDIGNFLNDEHLPVFDCAFPSTSGGRSIAWEGHVKMVAALQPFLSGSISKTINMPNESTVEDIERAYIMAWKLGCKSIAVYRDGCKQTQVLTTQDTETLPKSHPLKELEDPKVHEEYEKLAEEFEPLIKRYAETADREALLSRVIIAKPQRRRLPDERHAITHKFTVANVEGYLTVGLFDDGTPGEIFLRMAKEGSTLSGFADGFACMVSIALQYGVPLEVLVNKFSYTRFEPSGWTPNTDIHYASSIFDYVFRYLKHKFIEEKEKLSAPIPSMYMNKTVEEYAGEILPPPEININNVSYTTSEEGAHTATINSHNICPECGSFLFVNGTCHVCRTCGFQNGCSA